MATLHAPGHHPVAGRGWPITIKVHTRSGQPLRPRRVRYEFVFQGAVVAHRSPQNTFHKGPGIFRDTLKFPAQAAGLPITFRAIVTTRLGTSKLDYKVQVRRPR